MTKQANSNKRPASSGVKSAIRVFEIFELFNRLKTPLTISDISRELNYPISSTLMLLRCMTDRGYLTIEETQKSYFPTPRLSHMTAWVDYTATGVQHISHILDDLSRSTGETVVLSVEQGLEMVFLRILPSVHPLAMSAQEGSRSRIEASAIGLAALSTKSDKDVETIIQRLSVSPDRKLSAQAATELVQEVQKARSDGYVRGLGLMSPDIGAIAAPIPKGKTNVTYVVSVGGPLERIQRNSDHITKSLMKILRQLEKSTCAA